MKTITSKLLILSPLLLPLVIVLICSIILCATPLGVAYLLFKTIWKLTGNDEDLEDSIKTVKPKIIEHDGKKYRLKDD